MASVTRRTFLARTGLGTLAVGAAGGSLAVTRPARAAARVGEPAPTFTAPATTGAPSASRPTGARSWCSSGRTTIAPTCGSTTTAATCRRSRRRRPARASSGSPSSPRRRGAGPREPRRGRRADRRRAGAAPTAVLLDPQGAVGKMYGATNTPHMYVIDRAGMLVYAGAIDDRPTSRKGDVQRREQLRARGARGGRGRPAGEDARDPRLRLHRQVLVGETEDDMTNRASFLIAASVALLGPASVVEAQQSGMSFFITSAGSGQGRRPRRPRGRRPALPDAGAGGGGRRPHLARLPQHPGSAAARRQRARPHRAGPVAERQGRGDRRRTSTSCTAATTRSPSRRR